MPGNNLQTDAFVLLRRPPTDSFQSFNVFSAEHGILLVLQRVAKKPSVSAAAKKRPSAPPLTLDLFDEVSLLLESSNQGHTWFVKEARLLTRYAAIGRSYETLRAASALANLVARNPVHEESRLSMIALLRGAFVALETAERPDIVFFKSLYRFARDEGYPVKQEWFPLLASTDRTSVSTILNQPLAAQTASPADVARLQQALQIYLRGNTEIILDGK